jgi:hypothetical protein
MTDHDDEMTIPNHPHADQRNWQPGDTDDDDLITWEQIFAIPRMRNGFLRTLERMRRMMGIPPEKLAAGISPYIRIDQVLEVAMYLEEVAECMGKQMPQWKCAECGRDIWFKDSVSVTVNPDGKLVRSRRREIQLVRRDAHYCSQACRQKAYRKRKAALRQEASPRPSSRNGVTEVPFEKAA